MSPGTLNVVGSVPRAIRLTDDATARGRKVSHGRSVSPMTPQVRRSTERVSIRSALVASRVGLTQPEEATTKTLKTFPAPGTSPDSRTTGTRLAGVGGELAGADR